MKEEITLHTRREFMRRTVLGTALAWTVPTFLARTFSALQAEAAQQGAQAATGRTGTILVVVQLAGGNDGLNTVVPYGNDYYHRARSRLKLPTDRLHKLNDDIALHPSLGGFKELYDAGQLAIVQGAGYPNPNRSHFRSTEIWQTGSDANKFERHGWIGRYFDNACPGADPTVGVSIGRQMPQSFVSSSARGVSLDNPQNYRFIAPGEARAGETTSAEASFRKLNALEDATFENSGGSIGSIHGSVDHGGSALDFIERTALDAQLSSDQIRQIASRGESKASYPGSQLASSLKLVAKLIAGGLPTRVFYASQGGYDTHTNQLPTQERLLRDLGDSLKAFVEDLKGHGDMERVLIMTFSEFGRRVNENASGGTDHGAAAPMFVIGQKVKAGLLGKYPSLAPADLSQGDLRYTVDFRSVYATILESWLKTRSELVLGKKYAGIELI